VCVPWAIFFTTRQSNDTSASTSTGEPVASLVQLPDLKRASPLCAPLNVVESCQSSARSTLTQNAPALATAPCVVASLLRQTSTVGGSAVAEHTAVAVKP
jgi:hypothetical protein